MRPVAKVVKEYTEEYAAKLEARRTARAAKYAEDHAEEIAAEKAEQEQREAEWRRRENARICADLGCGPDGVGFILLGNTYPVKDKIKANGGKWLFGRAWVCPVQITAEDVKAKRVELVPNEYGFVSHDNASDMIWEAMV